MGRVTGGAFGTFIGKVGGVVGYVRLGNPWVRNAPKKSEKPRTAKQLVVSHRFKMARKLISHTREFVDVGYKSAALGTGKTAQNVASSCILQEAMAGVYPDFKLDYSKVLLSKGNLPMAIQPTVEYVQPNLIFEWSVDPALEYRFNRDQVMMLAYHPLRGKSFHVLSGNRRITGTDEMSLSNMPEWKKINPEDDFVETYIAFISDDRMAVSDSMYLGRIYLK
ncbi:hypothetical protein AQ505_21585 [Pedobacter sp. PACM 27299]|uniref:DUF6266 family protein n=1 Tax=Pedobacter sp. PACM 27299 TaxID=1727164 RepID=UPI000706C193|nr:DUF6266 family protein [Pedobacter sp. PACM 27299]ALL07856.1 hypothetical protein AQ505_21585 [Pedobacter sp. PACM 27299]